MWIALIFRWAFPYNDKHAVRWAGTSFWPTLPTRVCHAGLQPPVAKLGKGCI